MMQIDAPALFFALDRRRDQDQLTWRQLSDRAGVRIDRVGHLQTGGQPEPDELTKLLSYLGMSDTGFVMPQD